MKRVLFDTNVILDIALKRTPHFEHSMKLFLLLDKNKISGHITASTLTDIYYMSKRGMGHNLTLKFLKDLIEIVEIIGIDRDIIEKALDSDMTDFEDAIQVSAAVFNEIKYVITRNKKDFKDPGLQIFDPMEFLEMME